jgi:hypothetical protein
MANCRPEIELNFVALTNFASGSPDELGSLKSGDGVHLARFGGLLIRESPNNEQPT